MIAARIQYVRRRRSPGIAFHIRNRGRSIIHTLASALACLAFFGGLVCLMGLFG